MRYSKKHSFILIITVLVTLITLMYWNVYTDLIKIWSNQEEYSHGFMIPLVSLYFLWQKKQSILSNQSQSTRLGFSVIFFSLVIYFIGTVGDLFFLLRLSLIFTLIGLALLFVGYQSTKIMLTPILLLIFSFPLPPIVQATLTIKLQLLSSQLGVFLIRACDIPVYLEGNVIDLDSYQLQVVEACSGLRYLFPLMSLAFICAYLYQVSFWKKTLIFLTSIPITLFMNSFRIGIIGILVEYWGIAAAEGFIHDFEGWIVFMICFAILFIEMWLLSWTDRKTKTWDIVFGLSIPPEKETHSFNITSISIFPFYILIGILTSTLLFIKPLGTHTDVIPARQEFSSFPLQLSTWQGIKESMDNKTVAFLGLSDYILANFTNSNHKTVNFYIAYYKTQKHGAIPHSPKLCISGDGWQIQDMNTIVYNGIELNRVIIQKAKRKQLVYYWYKQRNHHIANEYLLKWNTFLGAFQYQRTDGALIRLTTDLEKNETFEIADKRLEQFINLLEGKLSAYIPD